MNGYPEVRSLDNLRGREAYRPARQLLVMMLGLPAKRLKR